METCKLSVNLNNNKKQIPKNYWLEKESEMETYFLNQRKKLEGKTFSEYLNQHWQ